MAGYFIPGEVKIRPGAYFNVDKIGDDGGFGAIDGVVAVVFKADFGPINSVTVLERDENYADIYGNGGTTDAIREAIAGGAKKIIACRAGGTGGSAATASLTAATGTVKITAKHLGAMDLSVTVRDKLTDSDRKECVIYTGTTEFERVNFAKGDDEVAALVEAFSKSKNFVAEGQESASGIITNASQVTFTAGENPVTATGDYSKAFTEVEKYFFNTICVDTEDTAVHALLAAFLERIYEEGQFGIGVVAEKTTKDLEERMEAAEGFDAENMVYVLNSKVSTNDTDFEGYQTAALIAGLIAATPANQSVTHTEIERYVTLGELLTNTQVVKAEQRGCLVLSVSPDDKVWIDSGINTLINPADNKDAGWKKIRRVKTRYELLYRANAQADALVGKVDNDVNGRSTIIAKLQKICNDMVQEGKLVQATVTENSTYVADTDNCYFDFDVIDKDSAEHIYLFYKFRFRTVAE